MIRFRVLGHYTTPHGALVVHLYHPAGWLMTLVQRDGHLPQLGCTQDPERVGAMTAALLKLASTTID
jgi:hypothetical protein